MHSTLGLALVALAPTRALFMTSYSPLTQYLYNDQYDRYYDRYSPHSSYSAVRILASQEPARPTWTATAEALELSVAVPALEDDSLSVSLAADGKGLTVSGKRAYEGCACTSTVLFEVPLPFAPRSADAVSVVHDERAQLLTLSLAKYGEEERAPLPLKISKPAPPAAEGAPLDAGLEKPATSDEADAGAEARQSRDEVALEDKFKKAPTLKEVTRLARLAVSTRPPATVAAPAQDVAQDAPAAAAAGAGEAGEAGEAEAAAPAAAPRSAEAAEEKTAAPVA